MLKAYAKINIGLRVLEKREDGYHDIDSYFHLIDLYDEIHPVLEKSDKTSVVITGNDGYLEKGMDIMEKAARAFSERTGISFHLSLEISKRIPSKAGLGGGSSDGAAVLTYLNREFGSPLKMDELLSLALFVGSDIPFFITGYRAAHVRGRGEYITEVSPLEGKVDLFFPEFSSPTSEAYYKLDTFDRSLLPLPDSLENITEERFPNDFELVIKRNPLIQRICMDYSYFSLSGSGSTYFGLDKKSNTRLDKSDTIHSISTFLL